MRKTRLVNNVSGLRGKNQPVPWHGGTGSNGALDHTIVYLFCNLYPTMQNQNKYLGRGSMYQCIMICHSKHHL